VVGTGAENYAPTRIRSPDRPAHNESPLAFARHHQRHLKAYNFFSCTEIFSKSDRFKRSGETRVSCLKEMVDGSWVEVNKRDAEGVLL